MSEENVIVRDTRTYKGVEITLTWVEDAVEDFGGFWSWMVREKNHAPHVASQRCLP
jgi:hypothetical protein